MSYVIRVQWTLETLFLVFLKFRKERNTLSPLLVITSTELTDSFSRMFDFQRKSEIVATFALCSFANPGSIGTMIATLTTLCPTQRSAITKNVFRAFLGGTVTCFLTAAIASKYNYIILGTYLYGMRCAIWAKRIKNDNRLFYSPPIRPPILRLCRVKLFNPTPFNSI